MKKYKKELLNMEFEVKVLDGLKTETSFFAITEDALKNVYHVLPTDSLEVARKKIMDVVTQDDFLYETFNKDKRIWELKSYEPGNWETAVKEEYIVPKQELIEKGYDAKDVKKPVKSTRLVKTVQHKLTIRFARRAPITIFSGEMFFKQYAEEFKTFLVEQKELTQILKYQINDIKPKVNNKEIYNPNKLLFIPDVELHIGKLASIHDSTDSYDYKKALYRYIKIMLEAGEFQDLHKAENVCMTIGNDFFNTDTEQNTTTAGTEQHNDTRFQQMISNGIVAHVWAIEYMKQKCKKVIIKHEPGNHDFYTAYMLMMQLCYLYKDDPKVEVDCTIKEGRWATCLVWGNNMIIAAHAKTPEGKALNDQKLSLLKDDMFREESRNVDNITVVAGHLHSASEKRTDNGVVVVRHGSPAGDGAWDSGNLYSSDKSHSIYLFDYNRGLSDSHKIKLTKEELKKGIIIPGLTAETNYVEVLEKSMNYTVEEEISRERRRLNTSNEKKIKAIDRKYEKMFKDFIDSFGIEAYTDEQYEKFKESSGYYEEVKEYLDVRETLKLGMKKK